MEAFGRGIGKPTPQDNHFNVATFFDARDIDGRETLAVDITNPFDPDGKTGGAPVRRERGGGVQYMFQRSVDAMEELGGADIYEHFWTYAATWTPTEITFFFGPDRDHLREIFRTPTPPDLHSPMAVIANDQVSAFFGWNPIPGQDHKTFAPGNTFQVEEIRIYALDPEREVRAPAGGGAVSLAAGLRAARAAVTASATISLMRACVRSHEMSASTRSASASQGPVRGNRSAASQAAMKPSASPAMRQPSSVP